MILRRLDTIYRGPAAIFCALVLQSCSPQASGTGDVSLPIWTVEFGHPLTDADAAFKRGDQRLLGIMGHSISVPGAPNEKVPPGWLDEVRVIRGTTDKPRGFWRRRFIDRATIYARAYNKRLLGNQPTRGVGLCLHIPSYAAGAPILEAKIVSSSGNPAWDEEVRESTVGIGAPSDSPPWTHTCSYEEGRKLTCPQFDCVKAFGKPGEPQGGGA
jgi:hypothetical protein